MKIVFIFLMMTSFNIFATTQLNQFKLSHICQDKNCVRYNEKYRNIQYSIADSAFNKLQIETAEVLMDKNAKEHNQFFLNISFSPDKTEKSAKLEMKQNADKVILYRHQVLSAQVKSDIENQNVSAKVLFHKKMSLSEINKICSDLVKNCKWKSELDHF